MTKIIPAILPNRYRDIETQVALIKDAAQTIQIDFVDGHFAPNRTWMFNNKDEEKISAILREEEGLPYWSEVDYEFDLMVKDPLEYIDTFIALGPSKIIFHIEGLDSDKMKEYFDSIPEVMKGTIQFGLAIGIETDPVLLAPLAPYISTIQCMGILKPGFQGHPFDERVYTQIEKVRALYPDKTIAIDGAVSIENAQQLSQRGASELVVGHTIFESVDPQGTIRKLKDICKVNTQ
jgi:ribulose-phosphate 3-epimerase